MANEAPVAVRQRSSATVAVSGQHPTSVALGHAQQLSGIGDGDLLFQNGVEHGESGLFFLVQRNVLHRDIFADHLADDRIVEQKQIAGLKTLKNHRRAALLTIVLCFRDHLVSDGQFW